MVTKHDSFLELEVSLRSKMHENKECLILMTSGGLEFGGEREATGLKL